jgi:hypothetical protein
MKFVSSANSRNALVVVFSELSQLLGMQGQIVRGWSISIGHRG